MMEPYLTSAGSAVAPGLGNHLWQSTLVAVIAGFLTLALRKHHARARYWLWLAASLKFLVPFSLLVELGQRLTWTRPSAEFVSPGFYFAIDQIGQPFSQSASTFRPHPIFRSSPRAFRTSFPSWPFCGWVVFLRSCFFGRCAGSAFFPP
jgi:bla regulator protein blaR1